MQCEMLHFWGGKGGRSMRSERKAGRRLCKMDANAERRRKNKGKILKDQDQGKQSVTQLKTKLEWVPSRSALV